MEPSFVRRGVTTWQLKKPPIRQAGSAEAFLDSPATGREHLQYTKYSSATSRKKLIRAGIFFEDRASRAAFA